ncbi:MAG: GIY-YIG nuclease family protein [Planctomycetaceae bacterium]|nr:GIY-YIG nuclease family protein [Planctomycetaceae bacterium]
MDKKHIINEIIRTANENNGTPLGKDRFTNATGIKWSDWYGKYWTKFGDAVLEAGFKPNKLQSAYDEDFLIGCVISLIREINKFPTSGDIRLKAYNTKGFPAHNTFRRLGKKTEMVQKLLAYCKDKSEYQDVIEICKGICVSSEKENDSDSEKDDVKFGYVYLMKSGGYYKIGKSDYVEKRNYEIGIKLPEELKIVHKIKTDDPLGIEAYWHKRFGDKRTRGEWFDLSNNDVKIFKRRTFM